MDVKATAALALSLLFGALALRAQAPTFLADSTYADSLHLDALDGPATDLTGYTAKLSAAGTLLLRSPDPMLRARAFDSVYAALPRAARVAGVVDAPQLDSLDGVSAVSDSAGAWRIYTWQHFVDDSTYRYGGLLVRPREDAAGVTATPLLDSAQLTGLEREYELTADQWYGALYYGAKAFALDNGRPAWVLFGYDADGYAHRRKVADVLAFGRSGAPLFGREVFVGTEADPARRQSRLILEYRADSRVGLNYDPALGGIVFDHLVAGPPVTRGGPPSHIPDGSYDGYVLDAATGTWQWRMEWFDRVRSAEPPRPRPLFPDRGGSKPKRDLFGRPRNR